MYFIVYKEYFSKIDFKKEMWKIYVEKIIKYIENLNSYLIKVERYFIFCLRDY